MYCIPYYNFHISYSIFTLLELGVWLPSVLVTDHQCYNFVYTVNIFSEFICLLQSMSAKYQGMRSSGIRRDNWRWRLKLLPQMSHKDCALMLFPLSVYLWMSPYVTTYKDEMAGLLLIPLLATSCISYMRLYPYDFLMISSKMKINLMLLLYNLDLYNQHLSCWESERS